MIITELKRTCSAFPTQWEGKLGNKEYIYIRYRFGNFTIGIGESLDEAVIDNRRCIKYGEEYSGVMSNEEMINIILDNTTFYFEPPLLSLLLSQDIMDREENK
jgi:hypothetical protein